MNRTLLITASSVLALAGASLAQNFTIYPSDHTGTSPNLTLPGSTFAYHAPFSYGIARQMLFYDAWDVRIPTGRAIGRLGFPRDESITSTGCSILLKLQMAMTSQVIGNVSATFDQNFSTPPTAVFANASGAAKIFALPDLGGPAGVDIVWLPLDVPFVFNASRNLVMDFQVYANQNGNNQWWYYLDGASHLSPQRSFGLACPTSGSSFPSLATTDSATWIGGYWNLTLNNGPSTSPTALLVGLSSREPGIPLDSIGGNGCLLSIDPLWVGSFMTQPGGYLQWSFPIPDNRGLFGARLYAQTVMQDVFANNLGWITSNGDEVRLGIKPQGVMVYGPQGNAQATTGYIAPEMGLITIFDHN